MSCPIIIDIKEIVRVNEFEGKEDSRGIREKLRFAVFKCDGYTLNIRVPFGMEVPEGYSAKAMFDCETVQVTDKYNKVRTYFKPFDLLKLKVGHKVEKTDVLQDFLSTPESNSGTAKK